ncbi:MAG: YciI family protein [Pirellulales bacterium]|nr:YciI family protein [Pirellulales bacterium]
MKFVCLGYFDETKFAELPQDETQRLMDECLAYDDELRRGGHFLGGEALSSAQKAVTLKMRGGEVEATDGPFSETKEVLGGILLLEARDLEHAVALISKHPGVKIGPFEIRPADEAFEKMVAERNAVLARKP